MRIGELSRRAGLTPRMVRYREALGLLPRTGSGHRRYGDGEVHALRRALELERRYDASAAELAFAVRVLADPRIAADVRDLGEQLGVIAPRPRPSDLERERALRWLGRSGVLPTSVPVGPAGVRRAR